MLKAVGSLIPLSVSTVFSFWLHFMEYFLQKGISYLYRCGLWSKNMLSPIQFQLGKSWDLNWSILWTKKSGSDGLWSMVGERDLMYYFMSKRIEVLKTFTQKIRSYFNSYQIFPLLWLPMHNLLGTLLDITINGSTMVIDVCWNFSCCPQIWLRLKWD